MLFIDYTTAFNTIVTSKLIIKLEALDLNTTLCNWVLDVMTCHSQLVKVGNNISTSICLPPQKIHRRCNRHLTANCPIPSGQEEYPCKNAVH